MAGTGIYWHILARTGMYWHLVGRGPRGPSERMKSLGVQKEKEKEKVK